jgi:ribosomal protein L31E
MKVDEVKIGKSITEEVWKRGGDKPPIKIRVRVWEIENKVVKAELLGVPLTEPEEKKEKPKKEEKKE